MEDPSYTSLAKFTHLTWNGEFQNTDIENRFRATTWPQTFFQMGRVCIISAVFYAAAGMGPVLEFGFTPKIIFLTLARMVILVSGFLVFHYSRNPEKEAHVQFLLILFLGAIGIYESVEAVIFYKPDLEFSTPFTLLIIFLMYLLIPLRLKPIAVTASFSSILYVLLLILFSVSSWKNCIQLSLFFLFANILGGYLFIANVKSRRLQFAALNQIQKLNRQLEDEIAEKEKANKTLVKLAITDELTGVPNRRRFMEVLNNEWERRKRYTRPLSLLNIDIDHFKKVNDTHGHQAGDSVLKIIANEIFHSLRGSDFMGRLGGEEFGVILPEMNAQEAFQVAERIRRSVESLNFNSISASLETTISIGVAQINTDSKDMGECLKCADSAMYQAKNKGRNRTVIHN